MKRRLLFILAACAGSLAMQTAPVAAAVVGYTYFDVSPSIPHKSGKFFGGVWNDRNDWLVTNTSEVLLVNGTDHRVTDLTSEIQRAGMFYVQQAAGIDGAWLLVGTTNTAGISYLTTSDARIFVEIRDGKARRVDLMPTIRAANPTAATSYWYSYLNVFRAGSYIFLASQLSYSDPVHVYAYADGSLTEVFFTQEQSILLRGGLVQDGDRVMTQGTTSAVTQGQWDVFDGRTWTTEQYPETADYSAKALFSAVRGLTESNLYPIYTAWDGRLANAYGMTKPRDAIAVANRRPDGTALLSGYGTNGLRLIVASPVTDPIAQEDELGSVYLTVVRVPHSSSRYVLTARADGSVKDIRILKDGIGIAKCLAQTCTITVDVKGTADRFEAWADSTYGILQPLTSKAVLLYDTLGLGGTPVWTTPYGTNDNAWTWASPSSFKNDAYGRMSWHVGASRSVQLNQSVCTYKQSPTYPGYSSACHLKLDPKKTADALATISSLRTDIYVEGVKHTSCTTPAIDLANARALLQSANTTVSAYLQTRIADCGISLTRQDGRDQVRIYAKISWTSDGKRYVQVTPTDTITFE